MAKFLGGWLMIIMACGGIAHAKDAGKAAGKLALWDSVEGLAPGAEINVLAGDQAGPDLCLVSTVDENALTCLREDSAHDVRLVFPRSEVRDVWVFELARNRHIGLWLGMGLGFFLGAGMCAELGPGTILFCGSIGAAIVASAMTTDHWMLGPGYPWPPPPPLRMRRRLVYRVP